MPNTLLLDLTSWDLVLDANGNIAMASEPYALSQDAASVCKTFLGEVYYDVTVGIPYLQQIFGYTPSLPLLKAQLKAGAETVPDVVSATVALINANNRVITGQVQIETASTGVAQQVPPFAIPFTVANPQGPG